MLTEGRDTVADPSLSRAAHKVISLTKVITSGSLCSLQPGLNIVALVLMYNREWGECQTCKQDPLVFIRDTHKELIYGESSREENANELLKAEGGMDVFIKTKTTILTYLSCSLFLKVS